MSDEIKLLPCPFCGGSDLEYDGASMYGDPDHSNASEWVNCNTCEGSGPVGVCGATEWNKRQTT